MRKSSFGLAMRGQRPKHRGKTVQRRLRWARIGQCRKNRLDVFVHTSSFNDGERIIALRYGIGPASGIAVPVEPVLPAAPLTRTPSMLLRTD